MSDYQEDGKTGFFWAARQQTGSTILYALIAMGCLYDTLSGFGSALTLQANLTTLWRQKMCYANP